MLGAMSELFRSAPRVAPDPPRGLTADMRADASVHGRFLRLFGAIWALVGLLPMLAFAAAAALSAAPWWVVAPGAVFAVAGALLWGLGRWRRARALRLFREGHEASGEVVEVFLDRRVRMNRQHPWRVVYAFTSAEGAARGTATCWGERPRVEVGDRVTVLHAPDDPSRSVLWTRLLPTSSISAASTTSEGEEAIEEEVEADRTSGREQQR